MASREEIESAKEWAKGHRKIAPEWLGIVLLDALTAAEEERDRLREALIAQAKKTAYYNGANPDAKAANLGFTYRWEEYLCDEARAELQEANDV